MERIINDLVKGFESGRMNRRQLITHLGAIMAGAAGAGRAFGAEGGSTFKGTGLNHIALSVTDVPRSRDFYIQHLGLSLVVHRWRPGERDKAGSRQDHRQPCPRHYPAQA